MLTKMHNVNRYMCPDSLWKNLWRVWKSFDFQQLNRDCPQIAQAVWVHMQMHNSLRYVVACKLCCRRNREKWKETQKKKFIICRWTAP